MSDEYCVTSQQLTLDVEQTKVLDQNTSHPTTLSLNESIDGNIQSNQFYVNLSESMILP